MSRPKGGREEGIKPAEEKLDRRGFEAFERRSRGPTTSRSW